MRNLEKLNAMNTLDFKGDADFRLKNSQNSSHKICNLAFLQPQRLLKGRALAQCHQLKEFLYKYHIISAQFSA